MGGLVVAGPVAGVPVVGPILALGSIILSSIFPHLFGGGGGGEAAPPYQPLDPVTGKPPDVDANGLNSRYVQDMWNNASPQQAESLGFDVSNVTPEQYIDPDWGIPKWVVTRLESVANPASGTRWIDILKGYPLFTSIPDFIALLNQPYNPETDYNYSQHEDGSPEHPFTAEGTAVPDSIAPAAPTTPPVLPPISERRGTGGEEPTPPFQPRVPPPLPIPGLTPEGGVPTFISNVSIPPIPIGGSGRFPPAPPAVPQPMPTPQPQPPKPPTVQAPLPIPPIAGTPPGAKVPVEIPTLPIGGGGGGSAIPPGFPIVGSPSPGTPQFPSPYGGIRAPQSIGALLASILGGQR